VLSRSLLSSYRLRILLTLFSLVGVSGFSWSILLGTISICLLKAHLSGLLFNAQLTLDKFVVLGALILESTNDLLLPVILLCLDLLFRPLVSLELSVILDSNQLMLKISERKHSELDVEVVEDI